MNSHNSTDSASLDWTRLLPALCRLLIVRRMDSKSRASWRMVCRQACQDVYVATTELAWVAHASPSPATGLPSALLSKLPSLHRLDFCFMSDLRSIQAIPRTLRSLKLGACRSLQDLSPLQHCTMLEQLTISGAFDNMQRAVETLYMTTPALSRRLRCMEMFVHGARPGTGSLPGCLAPLTRLRQLRLSLSGVSAGDWQGFPPILSRMTDLQMLHLPSNRFGATTPAVAQALGHLSQLTNLQLAACFMGSDSAGVATVAQAITALPAKLVVFDMTGNQAYTPGATALAPALRAQSATLTSLLLGHSKLLADGMAALAPGLRHCTGLTELDLQANDIRDRGATALAGALSAIAPSLRHLSLNENYIGVVGTAALVPALASMTCLCELNTVVNPFGPEGLGALMQALKVLPLPEWCISGNGLGGQGAQVLASGLGALTNLRRLRIESEDLGGEGVLIQRAAARLPSLQLSMWCSP